MALFTPKHDLPPDLFLEPFDERDEYWLGFVTAKLTVSDAEMRFGLRGDRVEHLRRFARLFSHSGELYHDERNNVYYFSITNSELLARFQRVGLTAKRRTPPQALIMSKHFWRGVADVKMTNYRAKKSGRQTLSFATRFRELAMGFKRFCDFHNVRCGHYSKGVSSWQVFVTANDDVHRLIELLYFDARWYREG